MLTIVPLGLLIAATWHDLRSREIPDWISVSLALWALGATAVGWNAEGWMGPVLGAGFGLAVTAPLFWLGGIGGGDVKLVAALGACLGPWGLLQMLFWVAVAGGVLALAAKLRGQSDFAYVPAILAGLVVYCAISGGLIDAH